MIDEEVYFSDGTGYLGRHLKVKQKLIVERKMKTKKPKKRKATKKVYTWASPEAYPQKLKKRKNPSDLTGRNLRATRKRERTLLENQDSICEILEAHSEKLRELEIAKNDIERRLFVFDKKKGCK